MQIPSIIMMLAISTLLMFVYLKNYEKGLLYSLFALIVLPQYIGIQFGGNIPVLTLKRIIVIISIGFWLFNKEKYEGEIPLTRLFLLVIISNTISLFQAPFLVDAIKKHLVITIEYASFFFVLVTSVKGSSSIRRTFNCIYMAIVIVAALGILELYFPIKTMSFFEPFEPTSLDTGLMSTFPHTIIFGVAMAIGLIISVYHLSNATNTFEKSGLWCSTILIGACLYHTVKRGPWLASMLGLISMFLLGRAKMKKVIFIIALIPLLVVTLNKGVYDTVKDTYEETIDDSSYRGASYKYRLELWRIAYDEISKSPERMAFGYGLNYHTNVDFYREFVSIKDRKSHFTSWDNEFAIILLEGGFVGLFFYSILYAQILWQLFKKTLRFRSLDPFFMPCIFSSVFAVVFVMTNVAMFSPQLMFIFYALVAIGFNYEPVLVDEAIK